MQISLSRGYFTGSHFTFDSQLSVACTQVSNISNWDCEHFSPLLFFFIANAGEFVCCLGRCFPRPVEWLSITMHRFVKSFITYIFICNEIDRCHDCHMIVICCHVSFFPGGFLSVFTVDGCWRSVMPWFLVLRRGQHVAMIDPRVGGFLRVLQARANPGEPGRTSSSRARCRFHTEKFTNFTGRARDFSRLGATGLLFQLDLPPSPLIPVDPRWSPLIPLHVLTCQEHGMELVAPRSSSEVPGKVPSVTWNLWLFGLFYLFFG